MSMRTTITLQLDLELFQIEEVEQAEQRAEEVGGVLYCWKTSGSENWLERGLSVVDVLGIIVLPQGLPDTINMPDDVED